MLGNLYYDEEEIQTCTETDLVYLWSVGYDFIKAGANMNETETGCQCKNNVKYFEIIFHVVLYYRTKYHNKISKIHYQLPVILLRMMFAN